MSAAGALVTENMEKGVVLHTFFTSVFNDKESKGLKTSEEIWGKKDLHLLREDQVRVYLRKLDIYKSIGTDRLHS